jgi:hypothetical protein
VGIGDVEEAEHGQFPTEESWNYCIAIPDRQAGPALVLTGLGNRGTLGIPGCGHFGSAGGESFLFSRTFPS